ncbi:MAG: hypothetical protein KatS3mg110_2992 [Pirellulaceae bacterium]|nr:MAG: hypothetical protein KatS3mg110_2992 [Pirellulaceae bacterium]
MAALLGLLVAVAPWPFASVAANVHRWEMLAITLGLCLLVVRRLMLVRGSARRYTELYDGDVWARKVHFAGWILVAALGWAGFQLVPLPSPVVELISPVTVRIWSMGDISELGHATVRWIPLSLQPEATFRSIALFAMAGGAFLLAVGLSYNDGTALTDKPWFCGACRPRAIGRVAVLFPWVALGGAGLTLAVFGILQQLTWNGLIYWRYSFPWIAEPFGPFVNRNNAAGCLNIAIGACVTGIVAVSFHFWKGSGRLHAFLIVTIGTVALLAAAILRSGSRGGLLSMLAASAVVVWSIAYRRCQKPLHCIGLLVLPLAAGLAVAVWIGVDTKLWQRYQSLQQLSTYLNDGRVANWCAGLRAFCHLPISGSGFGTYRYAYQPFELQDAPQWLMHAENVFVETLLEGGLFGLTLLLAGVGHVFWVFYRKLEVRASRWETAAAAGGLYILTSQCIHNCMDLGAYVPANLLWGSIGLGLAYGTCATSGNPTISDSRQWRIPWVSCDVLVLGALAACTWAYWPYASVARLVRLVERADERREVLELETLEHLATDLQRAISLYPGNAEAHLTLAKLEIRLWQERTKSIVEDVKEASLEMLYARAVQAVRNQRMTMLRKLREDYLVEKHLHLALAHVQRARSLCPILAQAHLIAGQLAWLVRDDFLEAPYFRWAVWCGPANPAVLIPAGSFQLLGGQLGEACLVFAQVSRLDRKLGEKLAELLRHWFEPEEIVPSNRNAVH